MLRNILSISWEIHFDSNEIMTKFNGSNTNMHILIKKKKGKQKNVASNGILRLDSKNHKNPWNFFSLFFFHSSAATFLLNIVSYLNNWQMPGFSLKILLLLLLFTTFITLELSALTSFIRLQTIRTEYEIYLENK